MSGLTVFWWLIVGHAACDYALQSDAMARGKNRNDPMGGVPWYYWLGSHSLIHGGAVALITGLPMLGLFETVAHSCIDYLKTDDVIDIHLDQTLHVLCKVAWVGLTVTIKGY